MNITLWTLKCFVKMIMREKEDFCQITFSTVQIKSISAACKSLQH